MPFASPIEPYDHLLGKLPDEDIAELAGVKVGTVAKRRQRLVRDQPERAREPDGTYRADDPATPDIDEAWVQPKPVQPEPVQQTEPQLEVSTPDDEVDIADDQVEEVAVEVIEPDEQPCPRVARLKHTYRCRPEGTRADVFFPRSIYRGGVLAKLWDVIPHDLFEVIEE